MTQQEAEVKLKVNSKEALDKINSLEQAASKLRSKFQKAFEEGDQKGLTEATKELNKVNKQIMNLRTNAANIKAAMKSINEASPKELNQTLRMINTELNSGRVPRGSKQWKEYCEQAKKVKRALAEINEEMRESEGLVGKLKNKFNEWGAAAAAGIAAFAGVVMSGKGAVNAYAEMEQEEANVRKFTGMTAEEVYGLNSVFKTLDTRTPRQELNKLAQEAGRLGKSSVEDVLGFVKAADQINVALDDLGEGATLTLSKLTGIFGDEERLGTEKSLLAVGSVINELSQNCSASAPYLTDFSKRLAGVGAQAKMTIPQIMSYAAVLDSQGQLVEASATAFSTLILKLYKDPAKFAKVAKLDIKEFSELVKNDANEAVALLLEKLGEMGNLDSLAPMFSEMGMDGARASDVLSVLAGNIDKVRAQQEVASQAFEKATSVTEEFNVQNNTVQAGLDKAKKHFNEMAIALGDKLLPVMRYCISGTTMMMKTMKVTVDFIYEYKGTILTLATSVLAYQAAVNAATVAEKVHHGWTLAVTAAKKIWMATQYLAAAATAAFTGNVNRANVAMKMFNATTKANPVGLLISVLVGAGTAIAAFATKTDKASAAQNRLAKAEKEAAFNAKKEMSEVERLYKKTQNLTLSYESRIAAAEKLKEIQPQTFGNLTTEAILAGQAAEAYESLADQIMRAAKAKAYQAEMERLAEEKLKVEEQKESVLESLSKNTLVDTIVNQEISDIEKLEKLKKWVESKKGSHAAVNQYNPGGMMSSLQNTLNAIEGLLRLQETIDVYAAKMEKTEEKIDSIEIKKVKADGTGTGSGNGDSETEKEQKAREAAEKKAAAERAQKIKEGLKALKAASDQELAINLAEYTTGQKNYKEYLDEKYRLDVELLSKQIALLEEYGEQESSEYASMVRKREEINAKYLQEGRELSLRDLEEEYTMRKNILTDLFFDETSEMFQNQRAYNQSMLEEELRFLGLKQELYADDSKEYYKVGQQIEELLTKDKLEKQKEYHEALKEYSEEYRKKDIEARENDELALLDKLYELGLISEEDYNRAKAAIRKKYRTIENEEIQDEWDKAEEKIREINSDIGNQVFDLVHAYQDLFENLAKGEDIWENLGKAAEASCAFMASTLQQFGNYFNASRDKELAVLQRNYDKQIELAGKNTKKKEALEKEKAAKEAAIKKKYNSKAMKIEIASAVAQTAKNAILGYAAGLQMAPPLNAFMGPILAAAATAQGMLQIAIIKKQHEAESAAYYEGGFTGGRNYRKEAGIVHEGEFVANHEAVNNPNLAPILRMMDYAQKTNTVGSLTAEDVSIALGQGKGVSARGEIISRNITPTINTNAIDTRPIQELNRVLSNGITSYVIMDGEQGLYNKYHKFEKLKNNPKR